MCPAGGPACRHRGARIRTGDLLLPKQARYRTAPHPDGERESLTTECVLLKSGERRQRIAAGSDEASARNARAR